MTWGLVFLILWMAWVAAHPWLARKKKVRSLAVLIVLEVAGFAGLFWWLQVQARDAGPSAEAATGLVFFGGVGILLVPALAGVVGLLANSKRRAD